MAATTKAAPKRFRLGDLKDNCKVLESVVVGSGLATADELAEYRPGGAQNRDRGIWGWVNWKCALVRFNARTEGHATTAGAEDPDRLILKALRREPARIEPVHAHGTDVPNPLCIHPKGIDALLYFHAKDVLLGALAAAYHLLMKRRSPEDLAGQIEAVVAEISYQNRLLAWACMHPEPWLPFNPYATPRPALPQWTEALDAADLLRIIQHHREVNGGQMRALEQLIAPTPGADADGRPLSWSVFASSVAQELNVPVSALLRDWTLAEVLAQTALAAGAKREAFDRAKAAASGEGAD